MLTLRRTYDFTAASTEPRSCERGRGGELGGFGGLPLGFNGAALV